jgi:hypothetical protein
MSIEPQTVTNSPKVAFSRRDNILPRRLLAYRDMSFNVRAFVGRVLLDSFEAKEMLGYQHSVFAVDTSVCIAAQYGAGFERLLRYYARAPLFSV